MRFDPEMIDALLTAAIDEELQQLTLVSLDEAAELQALYDLPAFGR